MEKPNDFDIADEWYEADYLHILQDLFDDEDDLLEFDEFDEAGEDETDLY